MYTYSLGQWLLFFFFYCLCGWIWECCFVSVRKGYFVNRGFLNGPWLPIYGTGAVLIMLVTLPVQQNPWLVWLFGVIFPTILEYYTGYAMEKMFKVKYWDYSNQKLNLHGYICLSSSIAWGFFSMFLIYGIHPFVDRLICRVPDWVVDPIAFILTILFSVDTVRSVQDALDFKSFLAEMTEEHEELRRLAKRAEIVAALAEDDLNRFHERTELEKQAFQNRLLEAKVERQLVNQDRRMKRKERLILVLDKYNEIKMDILDTITEVLDEHKERLAELPETAMDKVEQRKKDLNELLENIRERRVHLKNNRNSLYKKAVKIIRANPTATIKDYEKMMDTLREIEDEKNNHNK